MMSHEGVGRGQHSASEWGSMTIFSFLSLGTQHMIPFWNTWDQGSIQQWYTEIFNPIQRIKRVKMPKNEDFLGGEFK